MTVQGTQPFLINYGFQRLLSFTTTNHTQGISQIQNSVK
jgi:hypothetical protein